jgi:tetratricopeptide (TPR) repeat protein
MIAARAQPVGLFVQIICCATGLCVALQAGCGKGKVFESRTKEAPLPKEDKEFAEGAGRPPTTKTQYAYARVLASQRQDGACDALLTKLISEHPRFVPAYLLQAEVRVRMRRTDDAILILRSALIMAPHDPILLNNLGMCYLMKSDCPGAFNCFVDAASIQPSNTRYRANMALSLGLLGREEESESLYKMVIPIQDAEHNVAVLNTARGAFLGEPEPQRRAAPQTTQPTQLPVHPENPS